MEKDLSWSVPEYDQQQHGVDWYWTVGLVTLIIIIACIYFKNYLLGFLIFVGISTLTYLTIRKPEMIEISIDEKGITIRGRLYAYRKLKGFWVEEEAQHDGNQHLLIMTDRVYSPLVAIPVGTIAPETIRQALRPYLKEKELHENVSHRFMEFFGF